MAKTKSTGFAKLNFMPNAFIKQTKGKIKNDKRIDGFLHGR
jgi:hypothetical protein